MELVLYRLAPFFLSIALCVIIGATMPKSFIEVERELAQRIRALQCIEIEIGRMRRNYPLDAVEQDVFTRTAKYLKVLYKIYTEDC